MSPGMALGGEPERNDMEISKNLTELNDAVEFNLNAKQLLESLGFVLNDSSDTTYTATLPLNWKVVNQSQFVTAFYGPNGETVMSFF